MANQLPHETLYLLRGSPAAPGWGALQRDGQLEKLFVLHFDPGVYALVKATALPTGYEGLSATPPQDGVYLDQFGRPCYVAEGREVHSARAVITVLGSEAQALFEKLGDGDLTLERLGRAF